jgi:hypothetical protein
MILCRATQGGQGKHSPRVAVTGIIKLPFHYGNTDLGMFFAKKLPIKICLINVFILNMHCCVT